MPSAASRPGPPTNRQRETVRYLVSECGLQPEGLSHEHFDRIFSEDDRYQDFLHEVAIRKQLGREVFWALVAELYYEKCTSTGSERFRSTVDVIENLPTAPAKRAAALDVQTGHTLSPVPSDGLKRTQDNVAQGPAETDKLSTVEKHPTKRKKATNPPAHQRPQRQCPGSYDLNSEHIPCESEKLYRNPGSWGTHWDKCHRDRYKLKGPIDKYKYHCIAGCNKLFEHSGPLKVHLFKTHAIVRGDTALSPDVPAPAQTAGQADRAHAVALSHSNQWKRSPCLSKADVPGNPQEGSARGPTDSTPPAMYYQEGSVPQTYTAQASDAEIAASLADYDYALTTGLVQSFNGSIPYPNGYVG